MGSLNSSILKTLKVASKSASKIIIEAYENKNIHTSYKSKKNLVTQTDVEAEKEIISKILKKFPDSNFIAEESGIIKKNKNNITWIIDPIDGTNNFISGYPFFCISIAALENGVITHGSIYNPISNEFFYASKGNGSFLNDKKIFVSRVKKLSNSILGTGFVMCSDKSVNANMRNLVRVIKNLRSFRRSGSAALDLAYVACGRLDGFWHIDLKVWDFAAGILLVKEAGGKITDFVGDKFHLDSKNLLASNKLIHKSIIEKLKI
tara:strand:- start:2107 stop:2895 length:789 start_codon:yes stop_codon:yes gene_type:complete